MNGPVAYIFIFFFLKLKWIRITHKYIVFATRTVNRPGCIPPPPSCKPPPLPQVGTSISIGVWSVFVWVDTCICVLFCVLFVFVNRPGCIRHANPLSFLRWPQVFLLEFGLYLISYDCIWHIVTVTRKCLVSRDDTRQFWSRPDQKHDNSGRDANCISRC